MVPGKRYSQAFTPLLLAAAGLVLLLLRGGTVRAVSLGAAPWSECRVEGRGFPRRLVSPDGTVQILPHPPRRIASAVLAADQVLAELVGPGRVAAVSRFADNPELSSVAGTYGEEIARISANAERILSLEPDLVFVANFSRAEAVRLLVAAGVPVVRLQEPSSLADIEANLRLLGAAVGEERRAEELVAEMEARLEAVRRRVQGRPRPRVLLYSPGGFTAGPGTILHEVIERAGGLNVAARAGLRGNAVLSEEMAVGLEPEVLLFTSEAAASALQGDPRWAAVPAVRRGRVHAVPPAWFLSVSHHVVRGIEEVARLLHPEAWP